MLWKPNRGLQISEIDEEMFLVEFGDGKDKQKVLEMCPWSFEKPLIVLKEFEGELVPRNIVMKALPFLGADFQFASQEQNEGNEMGNRVYTRGGVGC